MKKILAATMFMAAALGVSAQAPDSIAAGTRVPAVAPADTSVTLSLERCLEIALSDNPSIKVADMEITRYDYSRKEVLGQLLPSVSFGVNYNRMLAKQVAYMNMDGFPSMGGGDGEEGDTPESRAGRMATPESRWVSTTAGRWDSTPRCRLSPPRYGNP